MRRSSWSLQYDALYIFCASLCFYFQIKHEVQLNTGAEMHGPTYTHKSAFCSILASINNHHVNARRSYSLFIWGVPQVYNQYVGR